MRPFGAIVITACLFAAAGGCARPKGGARESWAEVGWYRAEIVAGSGDRRSFRLRLWAEEPGRLHAEGISPTGSAEVLVDGGGGRLAVSLPRRRVAFVGAADRSSVERLLGISISLDQLVSVLLVDGAAGTAIGVTTERVPPKGGGLPERIEIRDGGRALKLTRRRIERTSLGPEVGTGSPPIGFDVLPIERLSPEDIDFAPAPAGGTSR